MKQYLSPEQTAMLMELGFEKPKFEIETQLCNIKGQLLRAATIVGDYSIGELIEMLPEAICTSHDDSCHYHLSMDTDACMWRVRYMDDFDVTLCATYDVELINALYDMIIVLKRQGIMPND